MLCSCAIDVFSWISDQRTLFITVWPQSVTHIFVPFSFSIFVSIMNLLVKYSFPKTVRNKLSLVLVLNECVRGSKIGDKTITGLWP